MPACRFEHGNRVVGEQRALPVQRLAQLEPLPVLQVLLGRAEVVRAVHGVEVPPHAEVGVLDREDLRVRIRDQHHAPAARAHARDEAARLRQPGDAVARLALEGDDVERERPAPVVHAVPVERAAGRLVDRMHPAMRFVDRDPVPLGEAPRQDLLPEVDVAAEVKHGAVHVEQNGVDRGPVRGMAIRLHVPMI